MKAGGGDEKSHETPKDSSKRKRTLGKEVRGFSCVFYFDFLCIFLRLLIISF